MKLEECARKYVDQYPDDGCGFSTTSGQMIIEGDGGLYVQPLSETEEVFLERLNRSRKSNRNLFYEEWIKFDVDKDMWILEEIQIIRWEKREEKDKIWWLDNPCRVGEWIFSFDKQHSYNMFQDYPWKLSAEQKKLFDAENPYWANFFKSRH